jgi:hypothetical protein
VDYVAAEADYYGLKRNVYISVGRAKDRQAYSILVIFYMHFERKVTTFLPIFTNKIETK